ncbi:MAG: peptide-methionine (R)-S-oxide reductase MsrB [Proteobacteria bacterium]|nr:peptide-methionine (R)-S-oxide reductase MsrB [Pseudomonadota bacterium]
MNRRTLLTAGLGGTAVAAAMGWYLTTAGAAGATDANETFPVTKTDAEWRATLSPQQYAVLRRASTERPGSSPLNDEHRKGTFACAGCALPLFSSDTKFDSRTGWPSFWRPLDKAIGTHTDRSLGMARTEVHCAQCGGHLGHVFSDGPRPTGLRYCMNGVALAFTPAA